MTFEEWWKQEAGVKNNGVVKSYIWKEDAKLVWNAAIEAAVWEGRVAVAMEGETLEMQVHASIKKLLTS